MASVRFCSALWWAQLYRGARCGETAMAAASRMLHGCSHRGVECAYQALVRPLGSLSASSPPRLGSSQHAAPSERMPE
jgi:hypothetical protein